VIVAAVVMRAIAELRRQREERANWRCIVFLPHNGRGPCGKCGECLVRQREAEAAARTTEKPRERE
jgi:hypothetical protein